MGYCDLFDFWKSSLPPPRTSWALSPSLEAECRVSRLTVAVLRAYPRIFMDRNQGKLDADLFAEAGVSLGLGNARAELVLEIFASRDSEILESRAHPTFEAGFAVRMSTGMTDGAP